LTIWVDADACPVVVREILYRAAERTQTQINFVSNHPLNIPKSPNLRSIIVEGGFDVADKLIAERVQVNDLVITSDLPLAADVIQKKGKVISSRGESYTIENIRSRLNIRDFMETMRASGIQSGGPPPLNQADRQMFANALDSYLTSNSKKEKEY
jgi:uncharacterized protein YaiI (UPF0178 family)